MKETLTRADVEAALRKQAEDLMAKADELRELDAAIGDGDLGITVTIGFQALCEALPQLEGADISTLLTRAGMAFNRKAASTFGALYATMLMRAARVAKGRDTIGAAEFAAMLSAAAEGVQERGKAQLGDKTMLDALVPAAQAAVAAVESGASLGEVAERAAQEADEGARATVGMRARAGRSSWFGERTEGVQDPGATAVSLMLQSFQEFVTG